MEALVRTDSSVSVHLSISHNERKVTCKHPVSGVPSQDNCIFVVNEQ